MSYGLDIAIDAELDLQRLVDALPEDRRDLALPEIHRALEPLAANPKLAANSSRTLGRPTYRFRFDVGGVRHHWAATFRYSEDEETIVITHIFIQPL